MKILLKNKFDDIEAIITNSREDIDLDLMKENKRKKYKKTLEKKDDAKRDFDNNVIYKLIYLFSNILHILK